jgi:hypothetical protein
MKPPSLDMLLPNTIFRSKVHNSPVADFYLVNPDEKKLTLFQVSSRPPEKHAIKLSTWSDLMQDLLLNKHQYSDYTIDYIYVTNSGAPSCPITFEGVLSNDRSLLNDPLHCKRLRFFIVLAPLDHNDDITISTKSKALSVSCFFLFFF